MVREQLKSGGVDLALTTETECGRHGETCAPTGWSGSACRAATPISRTRCRCRWARRPACSGPVAIEALGKARRDWRAVCEVSRIEPVYAVIEAGLAVAPLLRSSVPERFEILGREARLPALPEFRINLYAPPGPAPPRATSPTTCAQASPAAPLPRTTIDTNRPLYSRALRNYPPRHSLRDFRMKFLFGWALKLSLVGVAYVVMTSGFKIKLPEEILGYKVRRIGPALRRPQRARSATSARRPENGFKGHRRQLQVIRGGFDGPMRGPGFFRRAGFGLRIAGRRAVCQGGGSSLLACIAAKHLRNIASVSMTSWKPACISLMVETSAGGPGASRP